MRKIILNNLSPDTLEGTSFPIFAKFLYSERNLLEYKENGAIPFFIKFYDSYTDDSIVKIRESYDAGRRVPREYAFSLFHIYEIPDYGYQSLSPNFEDALPMCFISSGFKLPQKDIIYIRNYTNKKTYIMIPKKVIESQASKAIRVIINFKDGINRSQIRARVLRDGNQKFKFNLDNVSNSGLRINSIEDVTLFIREGSTDIPLTNSDYFLSFDDATPDTSTVIGKQETYFRKLQSNDLNSLKGDKVYRNVEVTVDEKFIPTKITEIYVGSKQYDEDYFYLSYSSINNSSRFFSSFFLSDVYRLESNGYMKKLIPGIEYYASSSTGRLFIPAHTTGEAGLTNNTVYEIHVRKKPERKITVPFTLTSGFSFDIKKALYENYIGNWNINKDKSIITIFKDGLLVHSSIEGQSSYVEYSSLESGSFKYVYTIENVTVDPNTSNPGSNTGVTYLVGSNPNSFTLFNKYQILTDPYFNTYGESIPSGSITLAENQEVYLYNQDLNFKVDNLEPRVKVQGGRYIVNDLPEDPYTNSLFTSGIRDSLIRLQTTELKDTFTNLTVGSIHVDKAEEVKKIEESISKLKENFLAIMDNSNITFQSFTSGSDNFIPKDFLFLIVKTGSTTTPFDLVYYNSSNQAIKREYSCQVTQRWDTEYIRNGSSLPTTDIVSGDKFFLTTTNTLYIAVSNGTWDGATTEVLPVTEPDPITLGSRYFDLPNGQLKVRNSYYISVPYFDFEKVKVAKADQNSIEDLPFGSFTYHTFK